MAASPARHIEKHFLERGAAVTGHDALGTVVFLDTSALEDDHAIAEPLDLEHVVGGKQDRRVLSRAVGLQVLPDPVGGVGIKGCGGLVE